ncbi:MAG: hypothetical protein AAFX50_21800, partial [Acidobacteriota bacterium]
DELATSGIEIGKLVAQGDLDAALEQLEETIHRRRGDDGSDDESASPEPPAPAAPASPPPSPSPPPAPVAPAAPPAPSAQAASTPGDQSLKPPPPPPPTRGKKQLPIPLVVGGVAAVVILGGLFAIFGGRSPAPETAPAPAPLPAPPPPVEDVEELGSLLVLSTPWAEVTEITDAAGFVHDLPSDPTTPLHLRLPEGLYRVTLAMPAAGDGDAEERICEVRVGIGEEATCAEVVGEPTAVQFFKDSGWWP